MSQGFLKFQPSLCGLVCQHLEVCEADQSEQTHFWNFWEASVFRVIIDVPEQKKYSTASEKGIFNFKANEQYLKFCEPTTLDCPVHFTLG